LSARFRLAHISDLHFNANPRNPRGGGIHFFLSRHDPATVRELLNLLGQLPSGDIDIVVVSGDVATSGDLADIQLGANFIKDVASLSSVSKVVAIPGNHDRYQASGQKFFYPGCTLFEHQFPYHQPFSSTLLADLRRRGSRMVVVGVDLALNPSDSSIQFNRLDRLGCGAAYKIALDAAERLTKGVRTDGGLPPFVVWTCHFPPWARQRMLRLLNEQALVDAVTRANVDLVLFGHTHEKAILTLGSNSMQGLISATTTEFSRTRRRRESRAFGILDVDVNSNGTGSVNITLYNWNDHTFTFQ
jgi:predicted phosphohydrolase